MAPSTQARYLANVVSHPPTVELRGPLVDELVSFESLAEDFKFALKAALELRSRLPLEVLGPLENLDTVAFALWISLAVAYGRCFKQGKRYAAARSLPGLPTLQLEQAHRDILELRDKHLAHQPQESPGEQNLTRLIIEPFALPQPKLTVHTIGAKATIAGNPAFLEPWIELLRLRVDQCEERIEALIKEIGDLAASNTAQDLLRLAGQGRPLRIERPAVADPSADGRPDDHRDS